MNTKYIPQCQVRAVKKKRQDKGLAVAWEGAFVGRVVTSLSEGKV